MALVTAIERQKRRQRFDIHLDGVNALTLGIELIVERHLAVGSELSDAARREIEDEDQRRQAIAAALRLIAATPRSESDLRDRLRRRGLKRAAVEAAITRMRELGYLDDAAYARFYVDARQASTPRSRRALTFELARKGVERDLASEAVAELSDADAAYAAAQRRLRAFRTFDRQTFIRRLGAFLASRGFGYGVARATIDRCLRERDNPDDEDADFDYEPDMEETS